MKKWCVLFLAVFSFVFVCASISALSDLQVVACEAAHSNNTCNKLDGLDLVTVEECCSALKKCCGPNVVSLADFKSALIKAIKAYFSKSPVLTTYELKDMIYTYFTTQGNIINLDVTGKYSGKKLVDTYNKVKVCVPASCSFLGKECGTWPDGCGGTLNCETCITGVCDSGQCSSTYLSNKWLFVFTYNGSRKLPEAYFNKFCTTVKINTIGWLSREAKKYGNAFPIIIDCYQQQVSLPNYLVGGETFYGPEGTINQPIKQGEVINYLENSIPNINNVKYVTIFHYISNTEQFYNNMQNTKYDFIYLMPAYLESNFEFELTITHEFMHKLGATDKYDGISQACLIDPTIGIEYNSYDIMCHRIKTTEGGFQTPLFDSQIVSLPTAKEIGWK